MQFLNICLLSYWMYHNIVLAQSAFFSLSTECQNIVVTVSNRIFSNKNQQNIIHKKYHIKQKNLKFSSSDYLNIDDVR